MEIRDGKNVLNIDEKGRIGVHGEVTETTATLPLRGFGATVSGSVHLQDAPAAYATIQEGVIARLCNGGDHGNRVSIRMIPMTTYKQSRTISKSVTVPGTPPNHHHSGPDDPRGQRCRHGETRPAETDHYFHR